jgi:uncharacterized protein (DUF1778 family)
MARRTLEQSTVAVMFRLTPAQQRRIRRAAADRTEEQNRYITMSAIVRDLIDKEFPNK